MSQSNPELARERAEFRRVQSVVPLVGPSRLVRLVSRDFRYDEAVGNLNAMTIDRRRSRALLDVAVLYILAEVFESLWVRG